MVYLDTSLVVASLVREASSERVLRWYRTQPPEDLTISDWVVTEFSAALSLKMRTGQIDARRRTEGLRRFAGFCDRTFTILEVSRRHFQAAARFADRHDIALRAGDALHLALAAESSATLVTLDVRMGAAAQALGVSTYQP